MKGKKRKGFTIIELAGVLTIMLILMVFFIPNISGVVEDSKKVGIMAEAKTVVFAWQTINTKTGSNLSIETDKNKLITEGEKLDEYFDLDITKSLPGDITVKQCMAIVKGGEFELDEGGVVKKE